MPTYEYACEACGHKFEEFQSIKAKPTTVCPKCKKKKVKRLISGGAGFLFKGSGFYIPDYRSDSYTAAATSDSAPAATPRQKRFRRSDFHPRAGRPRCPREIRIKTLQKEVTPTL